MLRLIAGLEGRVAGSPRARLFHVHSLSFSPTDSAAAGGGSKVSSGSERAQRSIDS